MHGLYSLSDKSEGIFMQLQANMHVAHADRDTAFKSSEALAHSESYVINYSYIIYNQSTTRTPGLAGVYLFYRL